MTDPRAPASRTRARPPGARTPEALDVARLEALVERFAELELLVVGDVILDEYLVGDAERVSPEAPVPVVRVNAESAVLGGAGNVVRNVRALGAGCRFCGAVGDDDAGRRIVDLLKDLSVDVGGVVVVEDRPTPRKTRLVARRQQIVRFDRETERPLPRAASARLFDALRARAPGCDAAVLEDYGKGTLAPALARRTVKALVDAGLPVCVDPKTELAAYRGASLVKPNLREAAALAGLHVGEPGDLDRVAAKLCRALPGSALAITRGGEGMVLFDGAGPGLPVPTLRREVFDMQGAGDTSIAVLALAAGAGATWLEACAIANAAAGVVVAKTGTATAGVDEVRAQLPGAVEAARRGAR